MTTEVAERPTLTVNDIVGKYIALRDKVASIKERHKQELAPYSATMEKLEAHLLAQMQALGADSIKTPHGTPYISRRTSVTIADWTMYRDWLEGMDALADGVDHKANKSFVESFIESSGGDVPPGINYSAESVVNVRRK